MPHREGIRDYLKSIDLSGKVVHDWGCGQKPIINYLPHKDCQYTGIDIAPNHAGFDGKYIGHDIMKSIELEDRADIAFCLEVLEHLEHPDRALTNIARNLKGDGILYVSVPFMYPIHSDHDLWRFTDQGLKFLLEKDWFTVESIEPTGILHVENHEDLPEEWQRGWVAQARRDI